MTTYASHHLAWQQRVRQEQRQAGDHGQYLAKKDNQRIDGMWDEIFRTYAFQASDQQKQSIGNMTNYNHSFGGLRKYPVEADSTSYTQQKKAGSTQRPGNYRPGTSKIYKGVRAFYPHDYMKRCGYEVPTKMIHVDTLGQEVRRRFNEDPTEEIQEQKMFQRTRSIQSASQRGLSQKNKKAFDATSQHSTAASHRRTQSQQLSHLSRSQKVPSEAMRSSCSRRVIDVNDIPVASEPRPADEQAVPEQEAQVVQEAADDVQVQDFDAKSEAPSVTPSQVSNVSYLSKLEKQLSEERTKRLALIQELKEAQKLNNTIRTRLQL